jgi:O-antigen ligase
LLQLFVSDAMNRSAGTWVEPVARAKRRITGGGVLAGDLRCFGLAAMAAVTTFNPGFNTRGGALLALLLAAPDFRLNRIRSADFWAVALAGLMVASVQWSMSPALTQAAYQGQIAAAVLFIALRMAIVSQRTMVIIGAGYLGGCLYGLWLLASSAGAHVSLELDFTNSYSLEGLNRNYTAYAMAAGVGIAVIFTHLKRGAWIAGAAIGIAAYAGIVLTGSRGAAIAAIATAIWWIIPRCLRRKAIWGVYGLTLTATVAIMTGWADSSLRSNVSVGSGRETGDLNGRLSIWPIAREAMDTEFWFGWGAGTFPAMNPIGIYAHNVLLDIGSGLGIVGVGIFVMLIWTALFSGTRSTPADTRCLVLGAALCCLTPPMLTGYWFQAPATWVALAIFSRMEVLKAPAVKSAGPS